MQVAKKKAYNTLVANLLKRRIEIWFNYCNSMSRFVIWSDMRVCPRAIFLDLRQIYKPANNDLSLKINPLKNIYMREHILVA